MDMELQGKVAIVTGGGRGLGKAIALGFANEGADVVVCDINEAFINPTVTELKDMGSHAIGIKADVTSGDQVNAMVEQVLGEFDKIDILVNNAGASRDVPFTKSSRENWDFAINLCLYGVLNCTRAVIGTMVTRKTGKIISIVSDAGITGEPWLPTYSAAKGGIIAFSKALAKEVGEYCVNINCVSPGVISTERTQERLKGRYDSAEEIEKHLQKQLKFYPIGKGLKRISTPEETSDAVIFLCSGRAAYITGQTLSVSGGYIM
jgi:2-hydroxycyclohexanecarboxyl-CoA dehydrogenase